MSAQEAHRDISHYLMHRYNWIQPHQFNNGLVPAAGYRGSLDSLKPSRNVPLTFLKIPPTRRQPCTFRAFQTH